MDIYRSFFEIILFLFLFLPFSHFTTVHTGAIFHHQENFEHLSSSSSSSPLSASSLQSSIISSSSPSNIGSKTSSSNLIQQQSSSASAATNAIFQSQSSIATNNNRPSPSILGSNNDNDEFEAEIAFRYAVKRINKDRNILPNTTLIYDIEVCVTRVLLALWKDN